MEELGYMLVRMLVGARHGGLGVYAALLQASARPEVGNRLRAGFGQGMAQRLAQRLGTPDGVARAHLFVTQLAGLLTALSVHEDPYLLNAPAEEIVERYGGIVQATLTGVLP